MDRTAQDEAMQAALRAMLDATEDDDVQEIGGKPLEDARAQAKEALGEED